MKGKLIATVGTIGLLAALSAQAGSELTSMGTMILNGSGVKNVSYTSYHDKIASGHTVWFSNSYTTSGTNGGVVSGDVGSGTNVYYQNKANLGGVHKSYGVVNVYAPSTQFGGDKILVCTLTYYAASEYRTLQPTVASGAGSWWYANEVTLNQRAAKTSSSPYCAFNSDNGTYKSSSKKSCNTTTCTSGYNTWGGGMIKVHYIGGGIQG